MKEKNKKILKGIGVGALACTAMIGLTGCANIKVEQSEVNKLIQSVETLKDQSIKMTKEEIWNFAQSADFNLVMNIGGVRDNLVVTAVSEEMGLQQDIMYIYNTEDTKIFAELSGNEQAVITNAELWYQKGESNIVLADIDKAGTGYMCNSVEERDNAYNTFEGCTGVYGGTIPSLSSFDLTYEKLNHYEVLENGNVRLTFVTNEMVYQNPEETEYVNYLRINTFEYSQDGRLVELEMSYKLVDWELTNIEHRIGMFEELNSTFKYVVSYGTVDADLMESWVELAEAKRNEQ